MKNYLAFVLLLLLLPLLIGCGSSAASPSVPKTSNVTSAPQTPAISYTTPAPQTPAVSYTTPTPETPVAPEMTPASDTPIQCGTWRSDWGNWEGSGPLTLVLEPSGTGFAILAEAGDCCVVPIYYPLTWTDTTLSTEITDTCYYRCEGDSLDISAMKSFQDYYPLHRIENSSFYDPAPLPAGSYRTVQSFIDGDEATEAARIVFYLSVYGDGNGVFGCLDDPNAIIYDEHFIYGMEGPIFYYWDNGRLNLYYAEECSYDDSFGVIIEYCLHHNVLERVG